MAEENFRLRIDCQMKDAHIVNLEKDRMGLVSEIDTLKAKLESQVSQMRQLKA